MNSFVVADPSKCIGCRTCEVACVVAHSDKNIFTSNSNDIEFNPRLSVVKTAEVSAPIQCRHCEDAPCANSCPNGSIVNKDGVVYIEQSTCVGCKTCLIACPLGAIELVSQYNDGEKVLQSGLKVADCNKLQAKERIVANKCDLCIDRENGAACIEICPTNALRMIEYNEINESIKAKRKQSAQELANVITRK
ncbi:4Fe-4S dicluster domain-containing protein [Clostridium sp. DJ247]|uniref:4Fe-4S dicluster domain-containing protein n=1 Tax=Clostridium sp. DJ247 TaxID=2726188 RepID=UPI001628AB42|nr:4Fe-4S dicluster domain-containing protein [Clostridium sp. DJ247]MBC2582331.1 4Fe-4S dicluster domain-containing protein [Clostridium sp. DJ247]